MRKIDFIHLVEKDIRGYRLMANDSIRRNGHMNKKVMEGREDIPQEVIDALLTDFLNYLAAGQCVDYAMYSKDLLEDRDPFEKDPFLG